MQLSCFYCGKHLTATAQQLGGEVVCPHCGNVVRLPDAEQVHQNEVEHQPRVHHWLTDSISGFASLLIHMGLLFILAAVTCDYRSGMPEGEEVSIGELPGIDLTDSGGDVLDTSEVEQTADTASLDELVADIEPPTAANSEMGQEVSLSQLLPSGAAGGAAGSLNTIGGGGGSVGAGTTFMGVRAEGSRICIIADCSGSMSGAKLDYVKEEILEAIRSMSRESEFQIVFFNSQAVPYNMRGWRNPKRDLDNVKRWLNTVSAQGGTMPLPAFEESFKLTPPPDAIFFMTDGLFEPDVVQGVKRLNIGGSGKSKIHAISFIDKAAEPLMRQIANDSGGSYRHVSAF
ncbi:vWA domain-containing protein [Bremerella sp. T1]|uniref:vWA domain-containing protein n=1 Tax=Bremerella sp. TYQ1 TaxID=3119568 RepID=UPI001CCD2613|nr:VWA domain-containing protein [Bremerella volcania]UBM34350.1 VWA domain-containing protein [Bremerella volcania]